MNVNLTCVTWRKSSYSGQCVEISAWRKSSYSGQNGGECVEIGTWRKSSFSTQNGGECVEVRETGRGHVIAVRDSKDPEGPVLAFGSGEWKSFTDQVKAGAFDLG